MEKYHRNLELFFWNDEIGDMDLYVTDINFDDLDDIKQIDIGVTYPEGEEVAIIGYKAMKWGRPRDGYVQLVSGGSGKDIWSRIEQCYVLFSRDHVDYDKIRTNHIPEFLERESAFDMNVRSYKAQKLEV